MELTQPHFERIAHLFPRQRGNVSLSHLAVLNAILYVAEQGCKWRGLPASFGNWHTIYTRMNRWAKSGVLDRVFAELQRLGVSGCVKPRIFGEQRRGCCGARPVRTTIQNGGSVSGQRSGCRSSLALW